MRKRKEKEKQTKIRLDINLLLSSSYSKFAVGTTIKNTTPGISLLCARARTRTHSQTLDGTQITKSQINIKMRMFCCVVRMLFAGFCSCSECIDTRFFQISKHKNHLFGRTTRTTTAKKEHIFRRRRQL